MRLAIGVGGLACAVICLGQFSATAVPGDGAGDGDLGPDVIVGDMPAVRHWGIIGTIRAFSVATTSCNVGDEDLLWQAGNNLHPVVGQNMFRIKNGRIEQIGQSWLKHTFVTINNGICGQCNGHLGAVLGVGCSDPYSASRNGGQSRLGPKSEVNAYDGVFQYPYGICFQCTGDTIYKRLQVNQNDINDRDDLYFIEGHYITQDDAQHFRNGISNGVNNASYRRIRFESNYNVTPMDTTQREIPAIYAWKDHGLGANQPDPDVTITIVDVPNEGRFLLGSKVSDLGNNQWRYEYAVQNLSSDRSGQSFMVPKDTGTQITSLFFRDVNYHSGEPWDLTDWPVQVGPNSVTWATDSFSDDPDANALRWGTLYNFGFTADAAPEQGQVTLGLFKPGTPNSVAIDAPVPGAGGEVFCPQDPGDYLKSFGGPVSGDAGRLCSSDDDYLGIRQLAQFTPLLPFIRVETWTFVTLDGVSEMSYEVEGRVTALVAGGQNPDTMRTSIRNYAAGQFEVIDERATNPNVDSVVTHTVTQNVSDYINTGDGEVRVRVEAWSPGLVFTPNWSLLLDVYQVRIVQ